MNKTRLTAAAVIIITVLTLMNHLIGSGSRPDSTAAEIGRTTGYTLRSLQTEAATNLRLTGDKPTLVLFFTSWCPYCNEDAPKLAALHAKYKDQIRIYGVNPIYRDEIGELQDYVDRHQLTFPILLDETGEAYKAFGEQGFPSLYGFSNEGEPTGSLIGSTDLETLEELILRAIKASQ